MRTLTALFASNKDGRSVIRLGYRHWEVPVTKVYPPRAFGYTKMRPIVDW